MGLAVMLTKSYSSALFSPSVYAILNLKVPVRLGVPERTPFSEPVKKSGRLVKVNWA